MLHDWMGWVSNLTLQYTNHMNKIAPQRMLTHSVVDIL